MMNKSGNVIREKLRKRNGNEHLGTVQLSNTKDTVGMVQDEKPDETGVFSYQPNVRLSPDAERINMKVLRGDSLANMAVVNASKSPSEMQKISKHADGIKDTSNFKTVECSKHNGNVWTNNATQSSKRKLNDWSFNKTKKFWSNSTSQGDYSNLVKKTWCDTAAWSVCHTWDTC